MGLNIRILAFIAGLVACVTMLLVIINSKTKGPSLFYNSKTLGISFKYPSPYSIEEKFNDIVLAGKNNTIMIRMAGSAGQTNDVETYIQTLQKQNSIIFTGSQKIHSNIYSGYRGYVQTPQGDKNLFFALTDGSGTIYTITTNSEQSADDADGIVGSLQQSSN